MKRYIVSIFIICVFIVFVIFMAKVKETSPVLNIISPSVLQIDMNNNGKIDFNETVCLDNVETPSLDITSKPPKFMKGKSYKEVVNLAYLASQYANNNIFLKNVSYKIKNKIDFDCIHADVYINEANYGEMLANNGFATYNGYINKDALNKNLKERLDLVLYNLNSNKYHELDCEFGKQTSKYTILPRTQLNKSAEPCNYCHVKPLKHIQKDSGSSTPLKVSSGSITMYITDFTKVSKPDKSCSQDVCKLLVNKISNAKNSIDIAAYAWDNIPNINTAIKKAKENGVKIRFVFDEYYTKSKETYPDKQIIASEADEFMSDLNKKSSSLSDQLMHNKFMIFDENEVITGSMNYTYTGLSGFNGNSILDIKSKDVAKLYKAEFEQMLSGKFHADKTSTGNINHFAVDGARIRVYFSPYDNAAKYLVELINEAKTYVYVPTFLVTHADISAALVRAKSRGVDVKIIIDANNTSSRHTKHNDLRKKGVPLKTEVFAGKLHSKSLIIDDKFTVIGSMNFSFSGNNKNDENMVIIEDEQIAKIYKYFFLYLWNKIPDKWLKYSAAPESPDSSGSCFDGIDNDYDGFIDRDDPGCKALYQSINSPTN